MMPQLLQYRSLVAKCAFILLLAACAEDVDPATETSVDPEPGLYEVTLSHGIGQYTKKQDKSVTICLRKSGQANFVHDIAKDYLVISGGCRPERFPREGNAVSGQIVCTADPKLAVGTNRFIYAGTVAHDHVTVETRIKFEAEMKEGANELNPQHLKMAMKAIEKAKSVINANRIGDCV